MSYITQIGTGNYNEKTSALYTDLSLITANQEIGKEAAEVFAALLKGEVVEKSNLLLVAPKCLQNRVLDMIQEEIDQVKQGKEGYIGIKINSLTDKVIINKLVEASQAGVKIEMVVRGICCLIPEIKGYTENIKVVSIVGRYLEHSRIYRFGTKEREKKYIASADFINKTKQKSFSKLSTAERMDWYNNKFYDYVDEIEKEKMTYFALCYQQTTLIINAPDENKAQEKFLGYKWSNRKGQEGIQILSPGGLLYDENDRNSQTHISSMIRNSFLGKECIVEGLEDYAYYLNLKDMLDFSSTGFTKTIKTIKTRELKTTPGLINYRLSDKSFELSIGNRVLSDEVEPDGLYPIYSANVFEEFGRISKQNLTDFTYPSIIWGIDGDWMVNIIPADQPFYPTDHCGVLRIKDNPDILPDYFALALEVAGMHEKFSRHNRASTQRIKKLLIQVPSKTIQESLLKKYHEITEKIKHEEDIIQTINQEIKQKYFDLYGTIESTKYSSSPLEKVCQFITDGTHQTPTYTTEGNGVKFLSSKDVTKEYIDWSNIEYIPFDLHEQLSKRVAPAKNDILLAKNGTIGIAALNDTDEVFDVYVSLAVLRPNELVTPEYLLCAINSEYTKKLFKDSIVGMGVPNLHLNVIQKTMIVLPDITEQLEFTSFVRGKLADKQSAILQKKELEDERKSYLLSNF